MRNKGWFTLLSGVAAILVFMFWQHRAIAGGSALLQLLNGRSPVEGSIPSPVPTAVLPVASFTSTEAPVTAQISPTNGVDSQATATAEVFYGLDAVIALLQDLQAKRNATYMQPGSGWWHIITHTESQGNNATFADGSPIPDSYTTEDWYFVDAQGYIAKFVSIQDTGSPATSQVVVFQNGILRDLNTGNISKQEAIFAPDASRIDDMREFGRVSGGYVQAMRTIWNGMSVYVVSAYAPFPGKVAGVPENAIGTLYKVFYSAQDGRELSFATYDQMADGSVSLYAQTTTTLLEPVQTPPDDILQYLKSVQ